MATTRKSTSTTGKSSAQRSLPKRQEARLDAVRAAFKDEQTAECAVRYGRKLLKRAAGLRSSAPPTTGLTKKQAEQVRTLLLGGEAGK